MAEQNLKAWGWAYHNPDTGVEWVHIDTHPVRSGECEDATDVRRMTLGGFLRRYPAEDTPA